MIHSPAKRIALLLVIVAGVAVCARDSFDYELDVRNTHSSCVVTVRHTGDRAGEVTLAPGDTHIVPLTDGEHRFIVTATTGCELLEGFADGLARQYVVQENPLSLTCVWTAEKPEEDPWSTPDWRASIGRASRGSMPGELLPDDGLDYDAGPTVTDAIPIDLEPYVVVECPRMESRSFYDISG